MPLAGSYATATPLTGDKLLGTKASDSTTKNYTVDDLKTFTRVGAANLAGGNVFTGVQDLSANGAYFGAAAASNLLNDYEEGTWTPSITGLTLTIGRATYTKIGRLVFISASISYSSGTGSGNFINGIPFSANASNRSAISISYSTAIQFNGNFPTGYVNSSSIKLIGISNNAAPGTCDLSTFSAGDALEFSAIYESE